jgi:outer membrane biosynthesis protein TonB
MSETPKVEEKKPMQTEAKKEEKSVEQPKAEMKPVEQPKPTPQPTPTPETKSAETKPETQPYKAIVVTDTCGFCQGIKEYISQQGLADKVKIINASTPEGRRFAISHGIRGVPECVIVEKEGKQVRVCSKEEFVKLLKEGS